jgi:hypothetical protein
MNTINSKQKCEVYDPHCGFSELLFSSLLKHGEAVCTKWIHLQTSSVSSSHFLSVPENKRLCWESVNVVCLVVICVHSLMQWYVQYFVVDGGDVV